MARPEDRPWIVYVGQTQVATLPGRLARRKAHERAVKLPEVVAAVESAARTTLKIPVYPWISKELPGT